MKICSLSASLQKSLSRIEKSGSKWETEQQEWLACFGHSGGHQRRNWGSPFRIAATCHSNKCSVFGPAVQKRLAQAGRQVSGALPPVVWLHRCFKCQCRPFVLKLGAVRGDWRNHSTMPDSESATWFLWPDTYTAGVDGTDKITSNNKANSLHVKIYLAIDLFLLIMTI